MSKGTILVADDSPTQQKLICAPFQANGYEVICAKDGCEALAAVEKGSQLALAVLDVVMPNMSGFFACKKIKKVRRELPIMLLSTKDQESDAFWGEHQGADLYMTKPFDSEELFANAVKLMSRT